MKYLWLCVLLLCCAPQPVSPSLTRACADSTVNCYNDWWICNDHCARGDAKRCYRFEPIGIDCSPYTGVTLDTVREAIRETR